MMQFLYPIYLYGLFAISIPIIIHLFNFRRYQKIYFPNVKFLEEVKQKTKKKSNIKHLLVLISRILVVASLVLAFAQPYIPVNNKLVQKGKSIASIYVDNSFSMEAESENGILIEAAKNYAREILDSYQATDDFLYTTNDFEGKHQRIVSKEDADEFVIHTEISPFTQKISEVVSRQKELMRNSEAEKKVIYIIGDFQKNNCDFESLEIDSSIDIHLIPLLGIKEKNIYIDSCWLQTPVLMKGQSAKINATIVNDSETKVEQLAVNLFLNDEPSALGNITIEPKSSTNVELPFMVDQLGDFKGRIEITDFPIAYDNVFYLNFTVNHEIDIAVINGAGENKYLNGLFGNDSLFNYANIDAKTIDYASLKSKQLVILNELEVLSSGIISELDRILERGASILIIPSRTADLDSYNTLLQLVNLPTFSGLDTSRTEVNRMNYQHELFSDIFEEIPQNLDLPKINKHYSQNRLTQSSYQYLLGLLNGGNLLTFKEYKKGKVYLLTSPLHASYTNFPEHSIFVPIMYKIAFMSNIQKPLYYTVGEESYLDMANESDNAESIYKITKQPNFEMIPSIRRMNFNTQVFIGEGIENAGVYQIMHEDEPLGNIAFNYNRDESQMEYLSPEEIKGEIELNHLRNVNIISDLKVPLSQTIKKMDEGIPLWKWFVITALFFLAIEILLLRLL